MEISNGVNHSKTELNFLLFFLLGTCILAFFIFEPFLYAIILAIIFATVFWPIHTRALRITREKHALAALLATASVLVVVIVPFIFIGVQIFQESTQLYSSLVERGGASGLSRDADDTIQKLFAFSPIPIEFSVDVNK